MKKVKMLMRTGILGLILLCLPGSSLLAQGNGQGNGDNGNDDKAKNRIIIEITPATVELNEGETVLFQAQVVDANGSVADAEIAWSVLNKRVGEIDETGLFTAIEAGHTYVLARWDRAVGRAEVIVRRDSTQHQNQRKGLHVVITPNSAVLDIGETTQFTASLVDTSGDELAAEFEWGVEGDFGVIDGSGLFEALEAGRGFVYATVDDLSGRAHVVVKDPDDNNGPGVPKLGTKMIIVPRDTLVLIDNVVQYQAFLEDTSGNQSEVYPEWILIGRKVGTIDDSGLFTADTSGNGVIKAKLDRYTATARVRVASAEDTAHAHRIEYKLKERDGYQLGNIRRIDESGVFKISGLPFPLNLLNGCEITLPAGALDQNITIDVSIPSIAEIREDSTVSFPEAILSGISFDVYVDGEIVSPYVFDEPVQIVLPYKPELMEYLGLTIDDLWVFFYTDTAGYEDDGVFNIIVDENENKIYVEVSHFSEILLGDKKLASTQTHVCSKADLQDFTLYSNYPNPFNPETSIRFYVGGQTKQRLTLRIYNLLGQEVRLLVDEEFLPGVHRLNWDGTDKMGNSVSSGIYLYRLESENLNLCRRMVLLR